MRTFRPMVRDRWSSHRPSGARSITAVRWREISIFVLVAFGASWLLWAPIVLGWVAPGEGVAGTAAGPFLLVVSAGSMLAPSLGVVVVTRWVSRPSSIPRMTGLIPSCTPRQLAAYALGAVSLFPLISVVTLLIGAQIDLYHFDLKSFSGMREAVGAGPDVPLVGRGIVLAVFMFVVGLPLMFGEEWGWRGYLEPHLQPLGLVRMVVLSGLIWGVWHLPAAFVDGRQPGMWITAYVVDCTLVGAILCWFRLRSGSIWPAVLGHAAMSGFPVPIMAVWLSDADATYSAFAVESLGGWVSWIVKAGILAALVTAGTFRQTATPQMEKAAAKYRQPQAKRCSRLHCAVGQHVPD